MASKKKLKAPPRVARELTGRGALPSPENLIKKTPEELIRTLNRFGIDPDLEGIYARGKRAYAKLERLVEEGLMPDEATMDQLMKSMQSEFEQNLRQMTKQAIRLYKNKDNSPGERFMWLTSGKDNVCPSCVKRHAQVKTFEEWEDIGLPGSVVLICNANCNCQLIPTEK